jgi:hypothetical protein
MVRYVLAKMGIDRQRVEIMNVDDDEQCDLDDECRYFTVRVDLAPHRQQTALVSDAGSP